MLACRQAAAEPKCIHCEKRLCFVTTNSLGRNGSEYVILSYAGIGPPQISLCVALTLQFCLHGKANDCCSNTVTFTYRCYQVPIWHNAL